MYTKNLDLYAKLVISIRSVWDEDYMEHKSSILEGIEKTIDCSIPHKQMSLFRYKV